MRIAFDVDGTLIDYDEKPRENIIELLKMMAEMQGTTIIVWSGGGREYALTWVKRLGLDDYVDIVTSKDKSLKVDIAFDDYKVNLAEVNITVAQDNISVFKEERW